MAERAERIGQRFGDYWLRRRLGGGAFGDVYLGEHVHDRSLAAIKAMQMRLTRTEELRAFINEVRTFRLQHPHIVRVLDVGIAADETPFLVMEYASNGTLRDRHPKGSRLPLATVLAYITPIASALQYAHDRQVIHRDVKPENMLLGSGGQVWLSDFGIATVAHSTHSLTAEGMAGTLPYMAPEQIQGKPRPQSDQYALAIVVYEWLTGARPFQGTSIEIAMQHQLTPPPALRTQVPTLPQEVEKVILTALSKDPRDRFGNIQAFLTALAQAPLEQSRYSEMSQGGASTTNTPGSGSTVAAKQRQAITPDPVESQATDASFSPGRAEPVSETSPSSSPLSPESITSSAVFSPRFTSSPPHAIPPQSSAMAPLPPTSRPLKRQRSSFVASVRILVILLLLGGVSFGVYHVVTRGPWMAQTSGTSQELFDVMWSGSHFVVVGWNGTILTSPDGRIWTVQNIGISGRLISVTWSGSQFVVVGDSGTILTSPDGRIWTPQNSGISQQLNGVAWSGSQFVAVGLGGTILTSPDGHTWTVQHPNNSDDLYSVAWSDSQFVAVGPARDSGTILTSPDGRIWTPQNSGTSQDLESVAWLGSQFVVVGWNGTLLTSPDGRTWTTRNSGTSNLLESVAWSGSQFVAVGVRGTLLISPDGRTWTAQNSNTSDDLNGVIWSGSQFVAVGNNGTLLTTP